MEEKEPVREEKSINLGELFQTLWKNKILIAIITVAVFLVGVIYTLAIARPQYRSSAMVLVAVTQQGSSGSGGDNVDYTNSLKVVNTVARLVREDVVLEPVAKKNKLSTGSLSGMVSVSSDEKSFIIIISVECGDSELSMVLANDLAEQLCETMEQDGFVDLRAKLTQTSTAKLGTYSSPNKTLYLFIFLIGGLAAGCVVVFILEFCSTKFRHKKDVELVTGRKVLGYFLDDKLLEDKKGEKDPSVSRRHAELLPASLRNYEPYNKLFTNIRYANVDHPYKVIMFTSSQERELKTTIISNFACALAYNAQRVLLIDLDLRKAAVHKTFRISRDRGIVDYVAGTVAKEEIIKHTAQNVDVITAGKSVLNPLAIIESLRLQQLFEEYKQAYDYILIDTPPLLACSDACAISKLCDGVVFNISMRDTTKKRAVQALSTLDAVKANVIGVNVTKAALDKRDNDSYYYYYSNRGYYSKDMKQQAEAAERNASGQPEKAADVKSKSSLKERIAKKAESFRKKK